MAHVKVLSLINKEIEIEAINVHGALRLLLANHIS